VDKKLKQGGLVADIGCGFGASTLLMEEAYPKSRFFGFDFHHASIVHARKAAEKSGLTNVRFETVTARKSPGSEYDLVAFFDRLHDMGDPVGALAHAREVLKPDGPACSSSPSPTIPWPRT
jgi:ubiquinone/menaquinone biosynthesis C-methylase UbiE